MQWVNFIKSYKMQQIYKGYNFVELLIGLNFKTKSIFQKAKWEGHLR